MIIAGDHVNQIIKNTVIVIIILVEDTMNTKKVKLAIMVAEVLVEVQPAAVQLVVVPQVVVPQVEVLTNSINILALTMDQIPKHVRQ